MDQHTTQDDQLLTGSRAGLIWIDVLLWVPVDKLLWHQKVLDLCHIVLMVATLKPEERAMGKRRAW